MVQWCYGMHVLYEYFILTSEVPFKSAKVSDRKTVKIFIFLMNVYNLGAFPGGSAVKESAC